MNIFIIDDTGENLSEPFMTDIDIKLHNDEDKSVLPFIAPFNGIKFQKSGTCHVSFAIDGLVKESIPFYIKMVKNAL